MDSKRASSSITDLGPELLNAIFCKLGPSPMHLAPLPSVCKAWSAVMEDSTWKQLCLSAAPALCTEMKYDAAAPSGGWRALYKLLFYCPGIYPVYYEEVLQYKHIPWFEKIGHVASGGFMTGPDMMSDGLRFRAAFLEDVLFVSHACQHYEDEELCGYMYGGRGLVRDFPNSKIAAALPSEPPKRGEGTSEYQKRCIQSLGKDPYLCAYCREPLYDLPAKQFFANNYKKDEMSGSEMSESEEDDGEGLSLEGYVCCNGHLTLGIFANQAYHTEALHETGGGLVLEAVRAVQTCCLHLGPSGSHDDPGPDFVNDLDLFSLPERVEAFLAAWESDVKVRSLKTVGTKRFEPGCRRLFSKIPGEPFAPESEALKQLFENLPEMGRIFEVLGERAPNTRSTVRRHLLQGTPDLSTSLGDIRRRIALGVQIELALSEQGVQKTGTGWLGKPFWLEWPDCGSVRSFVEAGNITVEDVIAAQRVVEEEQRQRKKHQEEYMAKLRAEEEEKQRAREAKLRAKNAERKKHLEVRALSQPQSAKVCAAKCVGGFGGTRCGNTRAGSCSHAACGKCAQVTKQAARPIETRRSPLVWLPSLNQERLVLEGRGVVLDVLIVGVCSVRGYFQKKHVT